MTCQIEKARIIPLRFSSSLLLSLHSHNHMHTAPQSVQAHSQNFIYSIPYYNITTQMLHNTSLNQPGWISSMKKGTNDPNRYVELASTLYAPLQWKSNDILEVKKKIGNAESMENIWRERQQQQKLCICSTSCRICSVAIRFFSVSTAFFWFNIFLEKKEWNSLKFLTFTWKTPIFMIWEQIKPAQQQIDG